MPGRNRPTLTPRPTYDAPEVDEVVHGLQTEIERMKAELDGAQARIDELEGRAADEPPPEILGRAMMQVQQIADKILADARPEAEAIVARAEGDASPRRTADDPGADRLADDDGRPSRPLGVGRAVLINLDERIG